MGELCGLAALDGLELRHTARLLRWGVLRRAAARRRSRATTQSTSSSRCTPRHERVLAAMRRRPRAAGAAGPAGATRATPTCRTRRGSSCTRGRRGRCGRSPGSPTSGAAARRCTSRDADPRRRPARPGAEVSTRSRPRRSTRAPPGSSPRRASTPSASSRRTATGTSASRSTAGSTTSTSARAGRGARAPAARRTAARSRAPAGRTTSRLAVADLLHVELVEARVGERLERLDDLVDVRSAGHRLGDHLLGHQLGRLLEVRGLGEDLRELAAERLVRPQAVRGLARTPRSSGPQQTFVPPCAGPCRRRRSARKRSTSSLSGIDGAVAVADRAPRGRPPSARSRRRARRARASGSV